MTSQFNPLITRGVAALLALLISSIALASDGALDGRYGASGRVTVYYDLGGTNADQAFGTAQQSDGRLVVVGSAAVPNAVYTSNKDVAISRLRGDGSLDTTFATQGRFSYSFNFPGFCANEDIARAVGIQSDGKIVVVGTASCNPNNTSGSSLFVMRLLSNGTLDPGFGSNGVVIQANDNYALGGTGVALYGNYIMVAGFVDYPGQSGPLLWVFNGSGQLVTLSGPFVADAGSRATSISVDQLGAVTLSGYYSIAAAGSGHTNGYDCFVERLVPNILNGTYSSDPSFGTGGRVSIAYSFPGGNGDDRCYAHAVDGNGRIIVVGETSKDSSGGSFASISRLTSTGSRDFGFSGNLFGFEIDYNLLGAINSARAVAIRTDNRIVVAGYGSTGDLARAPFDFGIVRFKVDGGADTSFQGSEPGARPGLAMIGFESSNRGTDDGTFAMALDKANRVYVVGQHQYSGADYDIALARLQSDAIFVDGFESP